MSLLIKALANAEKDKQTELSKGQEAEHIINARMPLELTPVDEVGGEQLPQSAKAGVSSAPNKLEDADELTLEDEAGLPASLSAGRQNAKLKVSVTSTRESKAKNATAESSGKKVTPAMAPTLQSATVSAPNQKVAAKAFVANQQIKSSSSKLTLAMLGIAGALMIWLGLQGYEYIGDLAKPEVAVIRPEPTLATLENAPITTDAEAPAAEESVETDNQDVDAVGVPDNAIVNTARPIEVESAFKSRASSAVTAEHELEKIAPNPSVSNVQQVTSADENDVKTTQAQGAAKNTSQRVPLKLVSKTPDASVDPTLQAAYQAFVRGDDVSAQQQYRQVLQRNVRNVDALLGMAAIAQRQGRDADAAGWYQKVLEIEPRNTIAQTAVVGLQANNDVVGTESRIKNMLAQQPDAANLHAALGNLYAAQNQWPAAQQAYFNASRFAPDNADYAFNLAISLDHLGKPNLALAQYQRALDLLNSTGASSPDKVQLEARIQALQ